MVFDPPLRLLYQIGRERIDDGPYRDADEYPAPFSGEVGSSSAEVLTPEGDVFERLLGQNSRREPVFEIVVDVGDLVREVDELCLEHRL